jgi:arylsulfatase A-like enzyme
MDTKSPNILLIITDSQRADTVAAHGNPIIRTPSLDRLVREGTSFTSAYTPSPMCVPARCALLYGQYPSCTGCYDNATGMPTDGRSSFVDALAEAGYRTHGVGKTHFTPDHTAKRGFQTRESQAEVANSPDEDDYLRFLHDHGFDHVCDPHGPRGETMTLPHPSQLPARLHPSNWVGDRTVAFIEAADTVRPWFAYSSFVHPHPPWTPPNPWHKLYRPLLMPPPNVPPDHESLWTWVNRDERRAVFRDQGVDWHLLRAMKAYYYACVSFIDFQVGRMIDALERRGQLDNTLIVFLSDHGEHLGDYLTFHLGSMHDSCARIPMLMRWPSRFDQDVQCRRPVTHLDVAPTLLNAANASHPTDLDGQDLADIAEGRAERKAAFIQFLRAEKGIYAVVTDDWKYAYSAGDDVEFLFDRRNDPLETRNVADMPMTDGIQASLRCVLQEHLQEVGEDSAVDGTDWRRYPDWKPPASPIIGQRVYDHPWADLYIPGYSEPRDGSN